MSTTLNPLKRYISWRGEYDYDSVSAHRRSEYHDIELDVHLDEWETARGWIRRRVRVSACGTRRDRHYTSDFLVDVPYFSDTIGTIRGSETTWITSPTRTEQIQHSVKAVLGMIDGRAARYFETEQAVREALQDHDRDDDADETLMVV